MTKWMWTAQDRQGQELPDAVAGVFPTQSEAEAYLGECWQELADSGIAAVSLQADGEHVYGPMSLDPA